MRESIHPREQDLPADPRGDVRTWSPVFAQLRQNKILVSELAGLPKGRVSTAHPPHRAIPVGRPSTLPFHLKCRCFVFSFQNVYKTKGSGVLFLSDRARVLDDANADGLQIEDEIREVRFGDGRDARMAGGSD